MYLQKVGQEWGEQIGRDLQAKDQAIVEYEAQVATYTAKSAQILQVVEKLEVRHLSWSLGVGDDTPHTAERETRTSPEATS